MAGTGPAHTGLAHQRAEVQRLFVGGGPVQSAARPVQQKLKTGQGHAQPGRRLLIGIAVHVRQQHGHLLGHPQPVGHAEKTALDAGLGVTTGLHAVGGCLRLPFRVLQAALGEFHELDAGPGPGPVGNLMPREAQEPGAQISTTKGIEFAKGLLQCLLRDIVSLMAVAEPGRNKLQHLASVIRHQLPVIRVVRAERRIARFGKT